MTTVSPARIDARRATTGDSVAISSVLAAAFHDDPVFGWVLPDDAHRTVAVRAFFDLVVDELAVHDDTWTTTAGVGGAALWVPYGSEPIAPEREEEFGEQLAEVSGPYADRMMEIIGLLDENHPHEPHEYLWFLGVAPVAQGHGIGGTLMAPVLDRADRAGVPCYLEATSPRNRALYERYGFRARSAIAVTGGPPLWPMVRPPR